MVNEDYTNSVPGNLSHSSLCGGPGNNGGTGAVIGQLIQETKFKVL